MPAKQTGNGILIYIAPLEYTPSQPCSCDDLPIGDCQWLPIACVFNATPPGVTYDTLTDEECLSETAAAGTCARISSSLGNEQNDIISLTIPHSVGYSDYTTLDSYAQTKQELAWKFEYPKITATDEGAGCDEGDTPQTTFYGVIQTWKGQSISKTVFMKTDLSILRTSKYFHACR